MRKKHNLILVHSMRGSSLTELLVTTGIIAITVLACSVLFSNMQKAFKNAERLSQLQAKGSNLRLVLSNPTKCEDLSLVGTNVLLSGAFPQKIADLTSIAYRSLAIFQTTGSAALGVTTIEFFQEGPANLAARSVEAKINIKAEGYNRTFPVLLSIQPSGSNFGVSGCTFPQSLEARDICLARNPTGSSYTDPYGSTPPVGPVCIN